MYEITHLAWSHNHSYQTRHTTESIVQILCIFQSAKYSIVNRPRSKQTKKHNTKCLQYHRLIKGGVKHCEGNHVDNGVDIYTHRKTYNQKMVDEHVSSGSFIETCVCVRFRSLSLPVSLSFFFCCCFFLSCCCSTVQLQCICLMG